MFSSIPLVLLTTTALAATNVSTSQPSRPLAAEHQGSWQGDRQIWRSQIVIAAVRRDLRSPLRLDLALPLAADTSIELRGRGPAALERDAEDRVTAILVPRAALGLESRVRGKNVLRLFLDSSAPMRADASPAQLSPPLLQGDAVQRVVFAAGDMHSFEADPGLEIVRHMTHLASAEVSQDMQHRCDRLLGRRFDFPDPTAIYLTASSRLIEAGGLVGKLASRAQQKHLVGLVTAVGGALLVVLLAFGYRQLSRMAARDSSHQQMQQRFEELNAELQQVDSTLDKLEPGGDAERVAEGRATAPT